MKIAARSDTLSREAGNASSTVDSWAAQWLANAPSSPWRYDTKGAYTVCPMWTSDSARNGKASGYAPKVLHHYKTDDAAAAVAALTLTLTPSAPVVVRHNCPPTMGIQTLRYSRRRPSDLSRRPAR